MTSFNTQVNIDVLAEDNIRTLEIPKGRLKTPVAILLVGIPASGKSYLVKDLTQALPLAVLSEEDMLKFLAPKITFFNRSQEQVIILAMKSIEKLIQRGVSCIFDYNLKKTHDRQTIRQMVEAVGGRIIIIHIIISKEEAYAQISKANYQVSRGEKKGVILNKDLFEYEVADTIVPLIEEHAMEYKPRESDSVTTLVEKISKITSRI